MNKIKLLSALITIMLALTLSDVDAQYWELNGNFVAPGQFFGSTNGQDLNFRTHNETRMRMHRTLGAVTINNQLVDLSGNLAIGDGIPSSHLALSRLHILAGSNNPVVDGYRSWMAYGIAFSVDGLDMYVGPGKFPISKI